MKSAMAYVSKQNPLMLAGGVVLIIGVLYYLTSKTIKDVASGAAGVLSGNNAITQNQTNASGQKVTAYEDAGVLGTLGAAFNSLSGGTLSTIGQNTHNSFTDAVDGWVYSLLNPEKPDIQYQ
jgi:hypothetical protein